MEPDAELPDGPDDLAADEDDPAGEIELFPASRVVGTLYRLAAAAPVVLAVITVAPSDSISGP